MPTPSTAHPILADLRVAVANVEPCRGLALPFGVAELDHRLAHGGLACRALHELAGASPALNDDAAATLFLAGAAARFAASSGKAVLWVAGRSDLFAPGLEQAGLSPAAMLHAQGRDDAEVLALVEDGARHGSLAAIVGEVKRAGMTVTRRLQLAATDSGTPILLLRRWKKADRCPFSALSAATTRWQIGCAPSRSLEVPGVGRPRWSVELARQRGGPPFTTILEGCDETGRLAPSAPARLSAAAADGAVSLAA